MGSLSVGCLMRFLRTGLCYANGANARRRTGEAMARRLLPNGQQLTHGAELLVQRDRALSDPPARRLLLELGSPGHPVGACLTGHSRPVNKLTRAAAAATISRDTTIRRRRAGMEAAAGGVKVVGPKD